MLNYKKVKILLISENTYKALIEMIGKCFSENRYLDRLVSVLGTKFAYNNTADLIHHHVAHYFPVLADEIGEKCLERYNIPVFYPATPEGGKDYNSVSEIIKDFEGRMIDFQSALMGLCKIAQDNGDIQIYADVLDILEDFNVYVEQATLLNDKIALYGTNPSFDAHVGQHFWILRNGEN